MEFVFVAVALYMGQPFDDYVWPKPSFMSREACETQLDQNHEALGNWTVSHILEHAPELRDGLTVVFFCDEASEAEKPPGRGATNTPDPY